MPETLEVVERNGKTFCSVVGVSGVVSQKKVEKFSVAGGEGCVNQNSD